jgi:hypothetical protein
MQGRQYIWIYRVLWRGRRLMIPPDTNRIRPHRVQKKLLRVVIHITHAIRPCTPRRTFDSPSRTYFPPPTFQLPTNLLNFTRHHRIHLNLLDIDIVLSIDTFRCLSNCTCYVSVSVVPLPAVFVARSLSATFAGAFILLHNKRTICSCHCYFTIWIFGIAHSSSSSDFNRSTHCVIYSLNPHLNANFKRHSALTKLSEREWKLDPTRRWSNVRGRGGGTTRFNNISSSSAMCCSMSFILAAPSRASGPEVASMIPVSEWYFQQSSD